MTMNTALPPLPPGMTVLERGWLSANNVIFSGPQGSALVDSGYCSHSEQTLALVHSGLQGQPLHRLLNTHLHSDHCGGNAALQTHYPGLQTWIPPGEAAAVAAWDEAALSYRRTGQRCPRFEATHLLQPGSEQMLGGLPWQVLAAPGHDPHAILLFQPDYRTLISGDALWENGFGVVFPELEGEPAYNEVGATLDLIEELSPLTVVPGHGAVFGGQQTVADALGRARRRLRQFSEAPDRHIRYGLKVLLKFKLLDWRSVSGAELLTWAQNTPYMVELHLRHGGGQPFADWTHDLVTELAAAGALEIDADGRLHDR